MMGGSSHVCFQKTPNPRNLHLRCVIFILRSLIFWMREIALNFFGFLPASFSMQVGVSDQNRFFSIKAPYPSPSLHRKSSEASCGENFQAGVCARFWILPKTKISIFHYISKFFNFAKIRNNPIKYLLSTVD